MLINNKVGKQEFLTKLKSLFIPDTSEMPRRRHDLDWLRVLAFGLLILYHCGMFYVVNWGWHVKSAYQSEFLENIMLMVEPWRMPILWIISGISIRFVLAKVSVVRFVSMRSLRLLLPLLFGVLVIVPPQLYVEMTFNGDLNMNYWQFLQVFFSEGGDTFAKYPYGIWPHIDVNHLWFLRSLWQYSLVMVVLLPLLNSKWLVTSIEWLFKQHAIIAILCAVLPIFIIHISMDLQSARYPIGFTFMLYGYLIGWNANFWQRLKGKTKPLLILSAACYLCLILFYNLVWQGVFKGEQASHSLLVFGMSIYSLMRVLGVLTAFALAYNFLNRKSKRSAYFNEAVYPFYILHQTLIVVIGYNLSSLNLGPIVEPILLITLTIISCFVGFEIIRRIELLRPCFGLKVAHNYNPVLVKLGYSAAAICIMPIAWQLL